MKNISLLGITSFLGHLGALVVLYITVFKVSKGLGFALLAFHGVYELAEWQFRRKATLDAHKAYSELLTKYNVGGNC